MAILRQLGNRPSSESRQSALLVHHFPERRFWTASEALKYGGR